MKAKQLTIRAEISEADFEERPIGALKHNYHMQSVLCLGGHWAVGGPSLNDDNQALLEFYLDRNRKSALRVENPNLVPQELIVARGHETGSGSGKDMYLTLLRCFQDTRLVSRNRKQKQASSTLILIVWFLCILARVE